MNSVKPLGILIVEDHHLIVETYKSILHQQFPLSTITVANNCKEAYKFLHTKAVFYLFILACQQKELV